MNLPEPVNPFETPQSQHSLTEGTFTALWTLVILSAVGIAIAFWVSIVLAIMLFFYMAPGFLRAYLVLRSERERRQKTPDWDRQMQVIIASIGWMLPIYFFTAVALFGSGFVLGTLADSLQLAGLAEMLVVGIIPMSLGLLTFVIGFHSAVKAPTVKEAEEKGKVHG